MISDRIRGIKKKLSDIDLTYSLSAEEALKWIPDNVSSYSVVKMQAAPRICRPFINEDYDSINYEEREWDNLIILDACRYDTFESINTIDGELEKVHSNASHTSEFLANNFSEQHQDIVYVSASPQLRGYEENFHRLEHVWEDGWDEEENTVMPGTMTDRALELYEKNNDKRMVIHFMQPHWPFIGDDTLEAQGTYMLEREKASPWELLYTGKVSKEKVIEAYENNLKVALQEVKKLAEELDGKTVITSDHGNLFGEKVSPLPLKIYGHPPKVHDSKLTEVPWLELPFDERREIKEEVSQNNSEGKTDDEEIKGKLKELGYLE